MVAKTLPNELHMDPSNRSHVSTMSYDGFVKSTYQTTLHLMDEIKCGKGDMVIISLQALRNL